MGDVGADIRTCQHLFSPFSVDICMIGQRLKQERQRLKLTQPEFAELALTKKRTLIDWEKGVSSPTAPQLAAMANAGVDVLYVITGQKVEVQNLAPDEELLLESYRQLSAGERRALLSGILSGQALGGGSGMEVSGDGNRVAGRDYKENK